MQKLKYATISSRSEAHNINNIYSAICGCDREADKGRRGEGAGKGVGVDEGVPAGERRRG